MGLKLTLFCYAYLAQNIILYPSVHHHHLVTVFFNASLKTTTIGSDYIQVAEQIRQQGKLVQCC